MANRYVYTGGSNTSPYDTWAKAATTLTTALTGSVFSDVIYVAHDHAESTAAAVTLTAAATSSSPTNIICVNRAGSVPPVSADVRTTATITTTGNSNITLANWAYIYGLSFIAGSGATGTASIQLGGTNSYISLVNCKLRLATTGTSSRIQVGNTTAVTLWENVTVQFGATAQGMDMRGIFIWRKTPAAVVLGSIPATMFQGSGIVSVTIEGVDLSNSSGTIFASPSTLAWYTIKDCKSLGTYGSMTSPWFHQVDIINSDTADTNTRNTRTRHVGAETTELTIVRTGGATDGTTSVSRKIVTTGNAVWTYPFEASPIAIWNETVGSAITLTVECISSAVLNTDDIWMDVEYLGTSGSPLGVFATTTKADVLATGVANTSSTATWGGALTGKFKLAATITAVKKGWVYVYPKVGKASTTLYIDPEITVT